MSDENQTIDGVQEVIPDINTPSYAYLDRGGVLHIAPTMEIAIDNVAPGKNVVQTMLDSAEGYPVINGSIVIYEDGKSYVNGNARDGHLIATPAEIVSLLAQIG